MKENIATYRKLVEESEYEYIDKSWVIFMLDQLAYCEEKGLIINPQWLRAGPFMPGDRTSRITGINADNI